MLPWNERQIFEKRLAETIKWCSRPLNKDDFRSALRSKELLPKLFQNIAIDKQDPLSSDTRPENNNKIASIFLKANAHKFVKEIVEKRSQIIKSNAEISAAPSTTWPMSEGKLLCWQFDNSNHDGAAQSLTNGFFGLNDDPPWDTWVHSFKLQETFKNEKFSKDYLICWIPFAFVETVDEGMAGACFDTLLWLNQLVAKTDIELPNWLKEYARKMQ